MIYLDHAASAPILPEALEAMVHYLSEECGNPSASHTPARKSKEALEKARKVIADSIGAYADEICFTSGGTESDNWALIAAAEAMSDRGRHIITGGIEHKAILETCGYLKRKGFEITYLNVDGDGLVSSEELLKAIRPDTVLISIMYANNEIGTVEPVEELAEIAREKGILFHTDAVQAFGKIPISVKETGIDLLSASAHKIGGPAGIGFLYIRRGTLLGPYIHGGGQERGKRAGTENVAAAVGFAEAVKCSVRDMEERGRKERELRDHLIDRIEKEIPDCRLNGHRTKRLSGNLNFSFRFVEGQALVLLLDKKGICVSSGSACSEGNPEPSHVLSRLGMENDMVHAAVRLSLSWKNTMEEVNAAADALRECVEKLRSLSLEYENSMRSKIQQS